MVQNNIKWNDGMDNIIKFIAVMEDIVNATATIDSRYYLFFAVNYDVSWECFVDNFISDIQEKVC